MKTVLTTKQVELKRLYVLHVPMSAQQALYSTCENPVAMQITAFLTLYNHIFISYAWNIIKIISPIAVILRSLKSYRVKIARAKYLLLKSRQKRNGETGQPGSLFFFFFFCFSVGMTGCV